MKHILSGIIVGVIAAIVNVAFLFMAPVLDKISCAGSQKE